MPPPPPHGDPPPSWPIPKFDLRVEDLSHPGAKLFFEHIHAEEALRNAVVAVCTNLYTPDVVPRHVERIYLVLRPMPGVAHTFGSPTSKEIHFSLDHIVNCASRARDEILGVLTHEMVHCYQFDGKGTSPGGLTEGIADWVRLRAGFAPPHWRKRGGEKWDAGYDATGYFLDWIEDRYGDGTIRELNEKLKDDKYHDALFKELTGHKVIPLYTMLEEVVFI
ncbi:hypothetical protein A0H81_01455 [Grifola frondosa]|uniref:Plant basic secretory protein n=1 Tax=Grifola frondosa TaxID=5627 RepID=A0A1C7MSQ6_GRIFR|nr:hypothetical protein A0H81_01455 [Grifola frondosa]